MFRKFNYNSTCRRQIVHCDGKLDLIVNKNLAGRRESANLETAILKRSNTRGGTMFRRVISKYISPISEGTRTSVKCFTRFPSRGVFRLLGELNFAKRNFLTAEFLWTRWIEELWTRESYRWLELRKRGGRLSFGNNAGV